MSITIRPPQPEDEMPFIEAVKRSQDVLHPWISAPQTHDEFVAYIEKYQSENNISYLAVGDEDQLVGCININEIVRGRFCSAFLGHYGFVPFVGKGLMKQAMSLVITQAFDTHDLHRLEANIQPDNRPSIKLVQSLGFRHEGYSPRYLFIDNQWRDHERYAITTEDWDTLTIKSAT